MNKKTEDDYIETLGSRSSSPNQYSQEVPSVNKQYSNRYRRIQLRTSILSSISAYYDSPYRLDSFNLLKIEIDDIQYKKKVVKSLQSHSSDSAIIGIIDAFFDSKKSNESYLYKRKEEMQILSQTVNHISTKKC